MSREPKITLTQLHEELQQTRRALATLVCWMVQSANSPIRVDEANTILEIIGKADV